MWGYQCIIQWTSASPVEVTYREGMEVQRNDQSIVEWLNGRRLGGDIMNPDGYSSATTGGAHIAQ